MLMFGRGWLFGLLLVAAAGLPYVFSRQGEEDSPPTPPPPPPAGDGPVAAAKPGTAPATAKAGADAAVVGIEQAFRWDVRPEWVLAQWPRVSAALAELELQGYRVPLVTGTSPSDIAGSLSYYFDAQQRLQRITFQGTTGDAGRLIRWLNSGHDFEHRIASDPRLVIYERMEHGRQTGELRAQPAEIVRAGAPHARYMLSLRMQRPKGLE